MACRLMPVTGASWARIICPQLAVVMPHTLIVLSGEAEMTSSWKRNTFAYNDYIDFCSTNRMTHLYKELVCLLCYNLYKRHPWHLFGASFLKNALSVLMQILIQKRNVYMIILLDKFGWKYSPIIGLSRLVCS